MMAARANCEPSRAAHLALAESYVAKIAQLRGAQCPQVFA